VDCSADVDSKAKRMSALAVSPSYQLELTGSLSLHHSDVTIGRNDGFLVIVVCCNLAFLRSGGLSLRSSGFRPSPFLV